MYNFTVPMALMDFVPVVFFGLTAMLLLRSLFNKMDKGIYVLLMTGSVSVFLAGFCKALWKLLYAANIADLMLLEEMFLPLNSLGLLFVGLSPLGMLFWKKKTGIFFLIPVAFAISMPFIMMMVVGLGGLCAGLSVVAVKMKKAPVMIAFILSFLCAMAMGFMSSQDSTLAWVNWAEQSINTVSQGCLLLGVFLLHKAGLKRWHPEAGK